jgi:hypothetical protein
LAKKLYFEIRMVENQGSSKNLSAAVAYCPFGMKRH